MQIVVNIPDKTYKYFAQGLRFADDVEMAIVAIVDGTAIPKGHGRLIDADKLANEIYVIDSYSEDAVIEQIKDAPTIIEKDKENA
jgi:hypothetical protein